MATCTITSRQASRPLPSTYARSQKKTAPRRPTFARVLLRALAAFAA